MLALIAALAFLPGLGPYPAHPSATACQHVPQITYYAICTHRS
jgi:hypothetical protein